MLSWPGNTHTVALPVKRFVPSSTMAFLDTTEANCGPQAVMPRDILADISPLPNSLVSIRFADEVAFFDTSSPLNPGLPRLEVTHGIHLKYADGFSPCTENCMSAKLPTCILHDPSAW